MSPPEADGDGEADADDAAPALVVPVADDGLEVQADTMARPETDRTATPTRTTRARTLNENTGELPTLWLTDSERLIPPALGRLGEPSWMTQSHPARIRPGQADRAERVCGV
ncbi:MAG TPA: hypothetical protein VEV65_06280 [Kineosporiaceae bacterium]|nr:hypothetical protein [Kineosporiaceae bacterium]